MENSCYVVCFGTFLFPSAIKESQEKCYNKIIILIFLFPYVLSFVPHIKERCRHGKFYIWLLTRGTGSNKMNIKLIYYCYSLTDIIWVNKWRHWVEWNTWHAWKRIIKTFSCRNLKKDNLENLGVHYCVIIKCILKNENGRTCTGIICLSKKDEMMDLFNKLMKFGYP